MLSIRERLKRGYNAFKERDPTVLDDYRTYFGGSSDRPDRVILRTSTARSIIASVYNRIAVDCSQIDIRCCKVTENNVFREFVNSPLDEVLSRNANIDQTGRGMIKDLVLSMFDEGCISVVPVITDSNPAKTDSFDVYDVRVGRIVNWYPRSITTELYNDEIGKKVNIDVEKRTTAIIENPFYSVMNSPNSTYQRLNRTLNDIDKVNGSTASGKLDMIIQLPYPTRSEIKKGEAEMRRREIEDQLIRNKHGIAYIDATEKIIQLNRPLTNNLWDQAKDLTQQLLNQLGVSMKIFDGTANEEELLNYYNTTIEPILTAIVEEMERKWITRTAYTQGHRIRYFRNPFKLVPVANIAEIADKFTRNEIMTSNELRGIIGMQPSNDPKADMLINSNLNQSKMEAETIKNERENIQNES